MGLTGCTAGEIADLERVCLALEPLLIASGAKIPSDGKTADGRVLAWTFTVLPTSDGVNFHEMANPFKSIGLAIDLFLPASGDGAAKRKRRRKVGTRKNTPLTPTQVEALQLVGEHRGNKAAAARAVGISRTAMDKRYRKALVKAPAAAMKKPKTQNLPHDKRGQVTVSADDGDE